VIDGKQFIINGQPFVISTRLRKGVFENYAEMELSRLKTENQRLQRQLSASIQMTIDLAMEIHRIKSESAKGGRVP